MLFWAVIGLFWLSTSEVDNEHDIHVSVCEVDISGKRMEVVLKTFLDDLQISLKLEPGQDVPDSYSSADEMIYEYVQDQISLMVDGHLIGLALDDISSSGDAIWITMKYESDELLKLSDITVVNSLLTEVYDDQTNLINLQFLEDRHSYILDRKKKEISISF